MSCRGPIAVDYKAIPKYQTSLIDLIAVNESSADKVIETNVILILRDCRNINIVFIELLKVYEAKLN